MPRQQYQPMGKPAFSYSDFLRQAQRRLDDQYRVPRPIHPFFDRAPAIAHREQRSAMRLFNMLRRRAFRTHIQRRIANRGVVNQYPQQHRRRKQPEYWRGRPRRRRRQLPPPPVRPSLVSTGLSAARQMFPSVFQAPGARPAPTQPRTILNAALAAAPQILDTIGSFAAGGGGGPQTPISEFSGQARPLLDAARQIGGSILSSGMDYIMNPRPRLKRLRSEAIVTQPLFTEPTILMLDDVPATNFPALEDRTEYIIDDDV